jgi:endo-1,4-beta-xylanase
MMKNIPKILILCFWAVNTVFAQTDNYAKTEQEYLVKAQQNIEKYRKGNATITIVDANNQPITNAKVEITQTSQDFKFGALLFELADFGKTDTTHQATFKSLFKSVFNFGVLPFYWEGYEKQQGKPSFAKTEKAIAWAKENHIILKGHPLAWTHIAGTPRWLKGMPLEMTKDLLKARIYNNVSGFKENIKIWDVVNEPITTLPWDIAVKDTIYNESSRYQVKDIQQNQIIPWVDEAYRWAYQANPKGDFILNEFYQFAKPTIRQKFYDLVKALQAKQTPIMGLGLQAHEPHEMWFSPVEVYKTLDMYRDLNLPIHITEFIPQSSGKKIVGWREGEVWTEETQAKFAEQFYTLAFSHPSVVSINWWSFSDKNSWLKGGGFVDENYQPKPAFKVLKKLIKEDWTTKNQILTTNKEGKCTFRGFGGNYQIKMTFKDGTTKTENFHVFEGKENTQIFQVK